MAGQLESAIVMLETVEIRLMYDSFLSLMAIDPSLPPDCIIECLENFFGARNGSVFTSASSRAQRKVMKNLETAYEAYKNLSRTSPKSAPAALIKTLGAIFSHSNPVKVETNEDESDSNVEIVDVESLQNGHNDNNDDDNNADQCQDIDSSSDSDCVLVPHEHVKEAVPSTSFSALPKQRQQWVKNWINGEQIPPRPVPTSTCSSEQDENDVIEVAPQNPAGAENVQENSDEIVSNGDSSFSNGSSSHSNQNKQENDEVVAKLSHCVYRRTRGNKGPALPFKKDCSYGCGKRFASDYSRLVHEKIHLGNEMCNCDFCDGQFSTRQQCVKQEIACGNPGAVKTRGRPRIPGRIRCAFCSYTCTDVQGLERHRREIPEELMEKCRFPPCTRKFCNKSERMRHDETHSE